jgi:hypothetical protein
MVSTWCKLWFTSDIRNLSWDTRQVKGMAGEGKGLQLRLELRNVVTGEGGRERGEW